MSKFLNRTARYKLGNAIIAQTLANGIEFRGYYSNYIEDGDWIACGQLRYSDVVTGVDGDLRLEALSMVLSDCDYNGGGYTEVAYKLSGTKVEFKEVIAKDRSSSVSFETPAGWLTIDAMGEFWFHSLEAEWVQPDDCFEEAMEDVCRDIVNNIYRAVFCPEMLCEEWQAPEPFTGVIPFAADDEQLSALLEEEARDNADKAIARLKKEGL